MLKELTGRVKRPNWMSPSERNGLFESDAVPVSQAIMVCVSCGCRWRQCELNQVCHRSCCCPTCGSKGKRDSMVEHMWVPGGTLVIWAELKT